MAFSQDTVPGSAVGSSAGGGRRTGRGEPVRIRLLGDFEFRVGSRVVGGRGLRLRKAASLIKLLALAPGHRMHREQAMEILWSELPPAAAANNFHYALHVARRAFDPGPAAAAYLRLRAGDLQLCPEGDLWIDVEAFERAADAARRGRDPALYRAALDLYAGDLLPEERYATWVEERRSKLRRDRLELRLGLAQAYEDRSEVGRAVEVLEAVVAQEPTHEEAHMSLMRLYAAEGRPYGAIMQYERLRETLRREWSRGPNADARRLYRGILARQSPTPRRTFAPGGEASSALPVALSSFVGRETETREVKRLLSMTRLLTLTGTGGVGKTRLAVEVARETASSYALGARLAELAPLSQDDLLVQAIAAALRVREEPGRPLIDTLRDALRGGRTLLVLDNCEHLLDATARLAEDLLHSCPDLTILATSREPLGITGETVWSVRSLSTPGDVGATAESIVGYEAVRLFVDRVRARVPGFELTRTNAAAVAEVCRRLDGLPLAIELATARMSVLTVDQVASRLDDAVELLTGGSRTAAPRHQTLRAALDWSYEPLTRGERELFGGFSVFAGGWTLEAAEAVGAGIGVEAGDVLDLLGSLVSKSLVTVGVGSLGGVRYGMLEPIRQYAAQMTDEGLLRTARRHHATLCLALAEEAESYLLGAADPGPWLQRLSEERDNLRAALSWALGADGEEAELGLGIAVHLVRFWGVVDPGEAYVWLVRALASSEGMELPLRARALNEAAFLALYAGEFEAAIRMLEESLRLSRALGDAAGAAGALRSLVYAHAHAGDSERVARLRLEVEALLAGPLDARSRAGLFESLTLAALDVEEFESALGYAAQTRQIYESLGDRQGLAISLAALGMVSLSAGRLDEAKAYLLEDLRLLREMEHKMGIAYCLLGLGGIAGEAGRPQRAARLWGAAERLRETANVQLTPFDRERFRYEERVAAARGELDPELWAEAWREGRAMSGGRAIEYALSDDDAPAGREAPAVPRHEADLTAREGVVAERVAQGMTNRQVASALGISERTVHSHVRRILKKLGLSSRAQVAAWVVERRSRAPLP